MGSAARRAAPAPGVPAMRRADRQRVDRLRGDRNGTERKPMGGCREVRMSERDERTEAKQEPVRVENREEFDEAVAELFRTGRPIEAPSLEALAGLDVDLEDEEGGIEGAL